MFKKLLLLTLVIAGFNVANMGAMNHKDKSSLNDTVASYNQQQKTIMGSLKKETLFTGVAMGCHFSTLFIAHHMNKGMTEKERLLLGVPTILIGMYAGKTITNGIHGVMDLDEKHKTAQAVGLIGAFWFLELLISKNLI